MSVKSIGSKESGFFPKWGFNTGSTWSGKSITADSALQNDTVWACVKLISEAVSTLPLGFYKRTTGGGRESAPDHPLYELLHNQPNARMSAVNYWQAVSASLLLWGNSYTEIFRSGNRIVSLEFLDPSRVRLSRDSDGFLQYEYISGTVTRPIARRNMMHIKSFTLNGEVGLSAIQYGRNAIGSAIAADQASDETFRDASRANAVVQVDNVLTKEQRSQIGGHIEDVSQNGGVYVLEKGMGYQSLKFNPVDAELLASRAFSVETICRWFRVPPVMIGHGDKQSSWPTSTDAQGALFVRYVLRACILGIEQEIRRALLTPAERTQYFAEYSVEGLLRGDTAARSAFYATALQNGYMTSNEVRALENLPPVAGGDELRVQSNLVPLAQLGQANGASAARSALLTWLNDKDKE
ncbi:MAG: phage portal protein [Janthinobacterium lividum]